MDSAVGLVQTYLRVNGYFTVVEYPVVELRDDFRAATDLDILAFRFPGSGRVMVLSFLATLVKARGFQAEPVTPAPLAEQEESP